MANQNNERSNNNKNNGSNGGRSRGNRRPSRRARAHAEVEAGNHNTPEAIPDHPLIPADPHTMITSAADLDALISSVTEHGSFAFDTEFIGEETYDAHMCLIQVGTEDMIALVDPLDGLDITPIWELVANPDILTLVHAGEQDFEPVVRLLGKAPENVIDTQVAAGMTGRPYPLSLRNLVEECCGVSLGKAATFTRWDRRPLSKLHQRYAADDVRYLPAILDILKPDLQKLGHEDWCFEECARRSAVDNFEFDPDARLARMLSRRKFSGRQRARARALLVLREEVAQTIDRPPRSVLKDDVLLRIAKEPPTSCDGLAQAKGFPRPLASDWGTKILETFDDIKAIPDNKLPAPPRREETPTDRLRIDGLWSLISTFTHGRGIDPTLFGTRTIAADLYWTLNNPKPDEPTLTDILPDWRNEFLKPILNTITNSGSINLTWKNNRVVADNST